MNRYRYTFLALIIVYGQASAGDMLQLLAKNNCMACHTVDRKMVGPSYADVSRLYHMHGYDLTEESARLRAKLKNGGKMPPKKLLSGGYSYNGICPPARNMNDDEVKSVVDWILTLN